MNKTGGGAVEPVTSRETWPGCLPRVESADHTATRLFVFKAVSNTAMTLIGGRCTDRLVVRNRVPTP